MVRYSCSCSRGRPRCISHMARTIVVTPPGEGQGENRSSPSNECSDKVHPKNQSTANRLSDFQTMKVHTRVALEVYHTLRLAAQGANLKHNPGHDDFRKVLYHEEHDYVALLVEACLAMYYQFKHATSRTQLLVSLCSFYHSVSGKSCTGSALRLIDTLADELSSDLPWFQASTSWIDVLDQLYGNAHRVVKSALGAKLAKVFNHVVAAALYAKMGIEFDLGVFGKIEKTHIRPTVWNVVSFVDAIVGLILFLLKAGRQAMLTGSVECFFIDDMVLTTWLDKASELRKDAEFMNNPSAVGMALPQYLSDVKECIATGKKMLPYFKSGREHTILHNVLLELECVLKRQEVLMMSATFRRAPIGIFLYGTAGVAKSFIATGLFNHYCSVRGITREAATMWTRTENDDYYSGYKSHFAGVLYDDASKYRPNVIQGIDPSIGDIITAINNIQFVTPQADLPDKGKIPFRSEWVGVTSNLEDLNASLFFNSTAAFLRRFAVRITPIVKEEFRMPGEDKIDVSKIPEGEQYPDLWHFEVSVPRVNGAHGEFVRVKLFEHYAELLDYMTVVYEKHIAHQDKLMETVGKIGPEEICACKLPVSICRCGKGEEDFLFGTGLPQQQSGEEPTCFKRHRVRVAAMRGYQHCLLAQHKDKVVTAFINQCYEHPDVSKWFNMLYCDADISPDDIEVAHRVQTLIDDQLREFLEMDARDRINALSEGTFNRVDEGPDTVYLSFEPEFGPPGHFLESQLSTIRNKVVQYCATFSAKELALLDVYLMEEAPKHIAHGWSMKDIIRGGYDYVKHYSLAMVDPDRVEVREFMLGTRRSYWYERLGVRVAVAYFEKRWVYKLLNTLTNVPVFQRVFVWLVKRVNRSPATELADAGRAYDLRLSGDNVVVQTMLAALLLVSTVGIVAKMVHMFSSSKQYGEPTVAPDAQVDLDSVGRVPTPRGDEKANVWTVKERAITRLDVDPRRPHDAKQAVSALRNNVLYAEVRGMHSQGPGRAKTRVLVVDSETFVINNHALPKNSSVELWFGPVREEGVRPTVVVEVDERMVTRHPARDVAIVKTWGLPHRFKNIKHMLTKRTYCSVGPASYYVRTTGDTIEEIDLVGVTLSGLQGLSGVDGVVCEAWCSQPSRPTVFGDCGAPLVVHSTLGSVIVGIHAGYSPSTGIAWAVRIFREDFDDDVHPEIGLLTPAYPLAQVGQFLNLRPSDKLYTDYHRDGQMMMHGQLKSFVARPKFTGTYTPYANFVFSKGADFEPQIVDNMAAPRNSGWRQPQQVLENYLHPTHSMNEMVVRACVEAYCNHITENFTAQDLEDIHPVPIDVAVNGYPGVPNVDAQKHATSAGHGKRGPKLQFLTEPEQYEVWDSYRSYDAQVLREIEDMREGLYKGIRPHAIYDSCWKNEMLSKAKVEAGRARSIYMCPVAFLTNIRMSTMALCRVMIRRRDVLGIAVGLNTHSEEWDDVHRLANRIPGDNWIAGDYKAFESVINTLLNNGASKVFLHMAKISGNYSDEEYMAFRTMLADIANATINFFGELITLLGGEASGHQLTTFFNCIVNVLLHMYAYVEINKENDSYGEYARCAREFFTMVFKNTLGDDVYLKVHPERHMYNHTTIQAVFASIGITYTMADKESTSRPYIPLEEVTFLKRSFVDHSAFPGMKVAALDRRSIYKMLCYTVPSHSASMEEQLAASLASAQAEAFFHDREFFDQVAQLVADLPKSAELVFRMAQNPPPTWNTMVRRFVAASPKLQVRMLVPGEAETTQTKHSYCHASTLELQTFWSVDAWGSTTMGQYPEDRFHGGVRLSARKVPKAGEVEITPELENPDFSKNPNKTNKNSPTPQEREMAPKVVAQAIGKVRAQKRKCDRRKKWDVVAQADYVYDSQTTPNNAGVSVDQTQQQVVFANEPAGVHVPATNFTDDLVTSMKMPQDLGNYFGRPRLIFTYAWAENGANGVKTDFNPWDLFFSDIQMSNKLAGFGLVRCKLHLKFLINGSPFYYGSMLAGYTPLQGWRLDTAVGGASNLTLVGMSQKPHVWLENQNCSSAEMELPFLFPYPYINTLLSSDLEKMGRISLVQYAPLLSANGTSSTNVDISVFAWATEVHLARPTNLPVMQSEFVPDGQISATATAVASAAGRLSSAPIIGPYARATEMVASGVGSIAKAFGFTNVPNIEDVRPMKQVPFSLATTEVSEPVTKLSVQAKQETAIGAEQHGGDPHDDLVIQRFVGRSSFVVGLNWPTTSPPSEILFSSFVNPSMFQRSSTQIAHTPMSYLCNYFQYWRGSIKFTFKVVRSPYHRGRIQIGWDGACSDLAQGPSISNSNTMTTIMDLDEQSECSITVPYAQAKLFLQCPSFVGTGVAQWNTNALPSGTSTTSNGVLNVRVLNRLTAPEASSTATILVFVQAGDDFEFAGPKEYYTYNPGNNDMMSLSGLTLATPQSDIVYDDAAPSQQAIQPKSAPTVYHQVFGERITSLRQLLHRSSLSFVWMVGSTNTTPGLGVVRLPVKRLPPPPGVYNNGWWLGTTSAGPGQSVFYTMMHPLTAITACFIGYKGSVNVTVNVDQANTGTDIDTLSIVRVQDGSSLSSGNRRPTFNVLSNNASSTSLNARNAIRIVDSGASGEALTNTKTNAGLVAQLPYYSNAGFTVSDMYSEYSNQDALTDGNNDWWRVEWRYNKSSSVDSLQGNMTNVFYASGPDFDPVFFINVPILNLVAVTPP
nr:MAG: hypothetical protein [Marnaviridae sp.]